MSDVDTFAVRACTADDVRTVIALVRADEERVSGRPSRLVEGDIRDWWQSIDLAANSWLLTSPGSGATVGVVWLELHGTELGITVPIADAAHPEAMPAMVDLVERRATELGLERLHVAVLVPDPEAEELLADRGYADVRRFFEMAIELAGPPSAVVLSDEFTVQVATPEEAPAFHETLSEAFQDHWEHHDQPFEEWWRARTSDPDFDISWWFTVRDGDRTVAAIRNVPARNGGVYVASLGVRRDCRGRGLAKALLLHTFARSVEAGFSRITLGVDASNPTGATALYRGVGMTTELETAVWEKRLGGPVQRSGAASAAHRTAD
ncbi:MAG TPA: GNAT family N-acetyltransferase [Kineosporiaceae bacterium]|nr:GNAT family N-acetyltransferase [Kineosporiaceae bacterium]